MALRRPPSPVAHAPAARRAAERAMGTFFRAATRLGGLRPALVPAHMRRQLQVIGIGDADLARVLRDVRKLADWPYAWEVEGDRCAAAGKWFGAAAAYYTSQRMLLTDSPLKRRLYALSREAYERIDQPRLEHLRIAMPTGETVGGYLQLPSRPRGGAERSPVVLLVPGVTATKEEQHPFVLPLLQRGYAVARIDNPGYGVTTGVVDSATGRYPAEVLEHLAQDARLDPDNMHLYGMSLGAHWVLHSSHNSRAKSATVVAPPFRPDRFFHALPAMNHTALAHMTGLTDHDDLMRFCETLTLQDTAPKITIPLRIFHGGRDRTVPVGESQDLAAAVSGPTAVTIYERDHHNCLEHLDDLIAELLEWLDDPIPIARAWARSQERLRRERAAAGQEGASPTAGLDAEPGIA